MVKHTPAPWYAIETTDWEEKFVSIGICSRNDASYDFCETGLGLDVDTDEEIRANAEHIVHCVNIHDELVEALEKIEKMAKMVGDTHIEALAHQAIEKTRGKS